MTSRLGLRARLTIFVTIVFAAALTLTSLLVVDAVEDRLVDDTRAGAEAVLSNYLESVYGGVAAVGVVDPETTSRFFYLDESGQEISDREYFATIEASFDRQLVDLIETLPPPQSGFVSAAPIPGLIIEPSSGVLSAPDGTSIMFATGPIPTGEPHRVDLGDDVVAVAQTLTFADTATVDVGVSNPLRPVTDSLDTITALLWVAVPTLVAAIALATWLAATRALRPVAAIATQADAISATNIHERLPLHEANDEIRHLGHTVNGMLDRLQTAQERQRQLVADASHELRSPVAASRTQLEVAIANPDTTNWAATAGAVLVEQERLTTLIEDLLTLSRLDETGLGAVTEIDLDDLIAEEASRQPTPVEVTVPVPVRVVASEQLLTRAVRNLLDNAVHHANDRVSITLVADESAAVVHVDDDGPGVPADQRDQIFRRFTRIDEARDRERGGAGLGLAIAHEVARSHHGDLTCRDSPLGGARLTLTVPYT